MAGMSGEQRHAVTSAGAGAVAGTDVRLRSPSGSAILILTVLDGEVAVPCNSQSAAARLNSCPRSCAAGLAPWNRVDGRVLRNEPL